MPGEDDRNRDYFGERPPPTIDPTKLTTEAVSRAETYLKELFDSRLKGISDLYSEKLRGLTTQITERDSIRDQAKIDANERIAAALQAQKEAVGKTESSFAEQMKSMQTTLSAMADGLRREISDLKDRVNINEGAKAGKDDTSSKIVSLISIFIAAAAMVTMIINVLLSHHP
jgi:hypothetical protein